MSTSTADRISRRGLLSTAGAMALASCAPLPASMTNGGDRAPRPNIVLYLADDLGWRDLGCYGSPNVKTPHLDQLAAEGMRFTAAFTASPICGPTRAQFYTGQFPVRSHAYFNHPHHLVTPGTKTIATHLKELGYRVGMVGKIDAGPIESYPFELLDYPLGEFLSPAVEKFLTRDATQPFCLIVGNSQPHWQWRRKPGFIDPARIQVPAHLVDTPDIRAALAAYYGDVSSLDDDIGACRALLESKKLVDNTLMLFTSEQGSEFPFGKYTLYDNGMKLAMIAHWPGRIKAGTVSDAIVQHVDVLPTVVEAAGGKAPDDVDGRSFLPVLLGQAVKHQDAAFGLLPEHRAVRTSRYKLIRNLLPDEVGQQTYSPVRKQVMKGFEFTRSWNDLAKTDAFAAQRVGWFVKRPVEELYDIVNDPFELRNLVDDPAHAPALAEMRGRLDGWMKSQGDEGHATTAKMKAWQGEQRKNGRDHYRESSARSQQPATRPATATRPTTRPDQAD